MTAEGVEVMDNSQRTTKRTTLETTIGGLSILDYGGSGVDALMFHAPGFCADSLALVAATLMGTCRTYSVELPGHGQSPADGMRTEDFWPVIPEIAAGLGLTRPILVGFDLAGFMVIAAAAANPDMAAEVVSVGGWCLRTRQETAEFLEFITADDVMAGLAERMQLGATAPDDEGMKRIMLLLARNAIHDFLIADEESRFAEKISCTVRIMDDGTRVRLPTVATMLMMYDLSVDDEVYPESGLLDRLTTPCTFVLTSEGLDQELIDRGHVLAAERDGLDTIVIRSGNNPQMSNPVAVGRALERVVLGCLEAQTEP